MRVSIPVVAGVALALATPVHAQSSDSVAAAEQLFEQARTLFDRGDFVAACPRFEASLKLDPALGTLLNLATCYEKLGKLASAWGHYREVIALATKAGDTARIDIARERTKALEPRLPRLTIDAPKTPTPGLVVTRDDAPLESAELGVPFYVDPGEHVLAASAPDRKPFSEHVTLVEGETKEVQLADLALAPRAKPAPATSVTTIIREDLDPGRSRRVFALTLGGAGAAAPVTGIGFGFAARASWNSAFDEGLCQRSTYQCNAAGQDRTDTARTRALVANIVGVSGLAMIAAGAALYVTAPHRTEVGVTPASGGAAVTLGGHW
jgi:hypothetical protein